MNKKTFFSIIAAATLVGTSCKNEKKDETKADNASKSEIQAEEPTDDDVQIEAETKMDFKTYFNSVKLGMTAEELGKVVATLPEEGIEWEGMHIYINLEKCEEANGAELQLINFRTEPIGTGEYYFVRSGVCELYEQKEGAVEYSEIIDMKNRFAQYISNQLGVEIYEDADHTSYATIGDGWAGTIEANIYDGITRNVTLSNGEDVELKKVWLSFTIQTLDSYAG